MKKKAFCLLLFFALSMITGIFYPITCPADEAITDTDPVISIEVPFLNSIQHTVLRWEFPYSDDFFRDSSDVFSIETARASMGLMASAFRNNGELIDDQYETYLKAAGFSDIYAYGYDRETGADTISAVIAHKRVDDFILIATGVCGQGYEKEWGGNLEVGSEEPIRKPGSAYPGVMGD